MLIDCDRCALRDTSACDDCVVSHLLDPPEGAVVFDLAEERALRVLGDAGLAPACRFRDRGSGRATPADAALGTPAEGSGTEG